jgi:dTDP-4-amino-4,6-dideoxygalactose transaminase
MNIDFVNLKRTYLKNKSLFNHKFRKIMATGVFILGEEVQKFELDFSNYIGSKYCVGLNSGLDALIFALKALDVKEGDEVIVPANTFIATVLAISELKAKPIFVEPDSEYNLDPTKIEEKITNKTKAIIVVHLYGQPAKMENILEIKRKYNLFLIEDCAQSHGAKYKELMTGSFGDISCFSFYPTKNLGAFGDGGCVITNNKGLDSKVRLLRNYGSEKKYYHEIKGYNSRLDELQAGLLNVKLKLYPKILESRLRIANYYLERINNPLILLPKLYNDSRHVFHLFVIKTDYRDQLILFLKSKGILTSIHYPVPPHLTDAYKDLNYKEGSFPITENQSKTILSLPLFDHMTLSEAKFVVKAINAFKI